MIRDYYTSTLKYEVIRQLSLSPSKSVIEVKLSNSAIGRNVNSRERKYILSIIDNRCTDEIFFMDSIAHTYVPKLITSWHDQEHTYFINEKIEGKTLWELSDSGVYIPESKKMQICLKLADALRYLHRGMELPVIHGDISPNNIIITEDFNPYLIDFGSSFISRKVAVKKVYSGTYGYFSPKLVGDPYLVDESVDVYSFGMIMKTLGLIDTSVELYDIYKRCVSSAEENILSGEELVEEFEKLLF